MRERDRALFFDGMDSRGCRPGCPRDDEPIHLNLDFLDGTRGAHVNISGISGVATKTSYATFLLYGLYTSGVLGAEAANTRALVFNVKGEDLLFLDHANIRLDRRRAAPATRRLGLPAGPFPSVAVLAPPRRGDPSAVPDVASRASGRDLVLLDAAGVLRGGAAAVPVRRRRGRSPAVHDRRPQRDPAPAPPRPARSATAAIRLEGRDVRSFRQLVDVLADLVHRRRGRPLDRSGHRLEAPPTPSCGACTARSATSST